MDIKAKDKDFLATYRRSDAEGRLNLMMNNYSNFPRIIRYIYLLLE